MFGPSAVSRLHDAVSKQQSIIHVTSAARLRHGAGTPSPLRTLRVDGRGPQSDADFFLLNVCRACADFVVTTAENLRQEPLLSTRIQSASREDAGDLADLRAALGKPQAEPTTVVMTTREISYLVNTHPVFTQQDGTIVYTTDANAHSIRSQSDNARSRDQRVIAHPTPSVPALLAALAAENSTVGRSAAAPITVSLEVGPHTAGSFYSDRFDLGSRLGVGSNLEKGSGTDMTHQPSAFPSFFLFLSVCSEQVAAEQVVRVCDDSGTDVTPVFLDQDGFLRSSMTELACTPTEDRDGFRYFLYTDGLERGDV